MDWKIIIAQLAEKYDQNEIASRAGIEPSTVTRLKKGEQTRIDYVAGCRLVALHKRVMRRSRVAA